MSDVGTVDEMRQSTGESFHVPRCEEVAIYALLDEIVCCTYLIAGYDRKSRTKRFVHHDTPSIMPTRQAENVSAREQSGQLSRLAMT